MDSIIKQRRTAKFRPPFMGIAQPPIRGVPGRTIFRHHVQKSSVAVQKQKKKNAKFRKVYSKIKQRWTAKFRLPLMGVAQPPIMGVAQPLFMGVTQPLLLRAVRFPLRGVALRGGFCANAKKTCSCKK